MQGGINPYAYVNNNPVNYTDPQGLQARDNANTNRYSLLTSYYGGSAAATATMGMSAGAQGLGSAALDYCNSARAFLNGVVPGAPALRTAIDSYNSGNYGQAAISGVSALAEAGLIIYTFGESASISATSKLGRVGFAEAETVAAESGTSLWPAASEGRQIINGIEYTTHALERMAPRGLIQKGTEMVSRGVPPPVVENAIKFGAKSPGNTANEIVYTFENVRVVTNPEATRIITVITTGR